MDPNETLHRIRQVRLLMAVYGSDSPDPQVQSLAFELFDLVGALDDWLSNGGFLPQPWSQQRVVKDYGRHFGRKQR